MDRYNFKIVEDKWQKFWEKNQSFKSKKEVNKKKFSIITIATPPSVQNKICKLNLKKTKLFFLEKPLTENYRNTQKLFKFFKKYKKRFFINFIFPNIKNFQNLKKIIRKKKVLSGTYIWKFKQAYFTNNKKNWKIINSQGGGLVNFYLIHVFYNLLFLIGSFRINKIFYKKQKILQKLQISLIAKNNIKINLDIGINENHHVHRIIFNDVKNSYKLQNISNDWVKNFKLYKNNNLLINNNNDLNRNDLTYLNLKTLLGNNKLIKEIKNFQLAHYFCNEINNFIRKN